MRKRITSAIGLLFLTQMSYSQWSNTADNTTTGSLSIGSTAGSSYSSFTINGPNTPTDINSKRDIIFGFAAAGKSYIRSYRGGSWDTYMQFLTSDATNSTGVRLHLNGDGNVGVGTTTPAYKLDINGSLNASSLTLNAKSGIDRLIFQEMTEPNGEGLVSMITGQQRGLLVKDRSTMTGGLWLFGGGASSNLTNSGGIGAGFVSDMATYIPLTNATSAITFTNGEINFFANSGLTTGQSYYPSPKMYMNSSGNVGIGTTSPQQKLHVTNGAVMASDVSFNTINVRMDGTSIPALRFTRWLGSASYQHNAFVGQFYNSSEYSFGIGTGSSSTGDQNATNMVLTATL